MYIPVSAYGMQNLTEGVERYLSMISWEEEWEKEKKETEEQSSSDEL